MRVTRLVGAAIAAAAVLHQVASRSAAANASGVGAAADVAVGNTAAAPTEPSAHDFDAFLGTWAFHSRSKNPKNPPEMDGRWTWSRSGAEAVVEDDYQVIDTAGTRRYLGVTYRAYDEKTRRWANAFVQPPGVRWSVGEAWRDGADMVEGPADSTKKTRARFVMLSPDHFTWTFDVSQDGGKTWINEWVKADARRVK